MRRTPALLTAAVLAVGLACSGSAAAGAAPAAIPAGRADARVLLQHLTVRADSHAGSYQRSRFAVWNDADRDGEDTRAEVLKAESRVTASVNAHHTVKGGKWTSAYDNVVVTKASRLDVDHLVPLAEAWRSGAWKWSAKQRQAFGNDLGYGPSLIAVTLSSNRAKGDADPAEWMPAASSYACAYVKQWIGVKSRWHLSVDRKERSALKAGLRGCGSFAVARPGTPRIASLVPAPRPSDVPAPAATPSAAPVATAPTPDPVMTATPAPTSASTPTPTPTASPAPSSSRYYKNCDAVRAAGAAPLHRGDPGYETPRLDRDGDGVACE